MTDGDEEPFDPEERDTERKAVRTYIPAYQKELWQDDADEMGMSMSEFIRTMTQAGRRDIVDPDPEADESTDEPPSDDWLRERVLATLEDGPVSFDELERDVVDDIAADLDEVLNDLQDEQRVRYSGRRGGYVLLDDE